VSLASLVLLFAGSIAPLLADGSHHTSQGQPGPNGGVLFTTSFMIGITGLLLGPVKDCATGEIIEPGRLSAMFVFPTEAQRSLHWSQLIKVVLSAEGFQPREITQFTIFRLTLGFLTLTFVIPIEAHICVNQGACNAPNIAIKWGQGAGLPQFPVAGGGIVRLQIPVGVPRAFDVVADDGDPTLATDYLTLFARDLTTALPPGAEWRPPIEAPFAKNLSGVFTWTPTPQDLRAAPYVIRFRARDACPGAEATVQVELTVVINLPNLNIVNVRTLQLGGGHWRVIFNVQNQSNVGARATQVRIRGVRLGDGRERTESYGTGALGPFAMTGDLFVDFAVNFANRDYDVELFVDPENRVAEADENDNVVSLQLRAR
jgi:hypothetical protein